MDIHNVPGCCTGAFITYPQSIFQAKDGKTPLQDLSKDRLRSIKIDTTIWMNSIHRFGNNTRTNGYMCDYKIIYLILTKNQAVSLGLSRTMDTLGFSPVFNTGLHGNSRHQETGELIMYCNTPQNLVETINKLLEEIESLLKKPAVSEEEIKRRQSIKPFAVTVLKTLKGIEDRRWVLDNIINHKNPLIRKKLSDEIEAVTGGYRLDTDPILSTEDLVTLRRIKERVNEWRNGDF